MAKGKAFLVPVVILVVVGLLCPGMAVNAQGMGKRPGLSQTEIKEKGQAAHEKGKMRWESLSPEEQAYVAEKGKERAAQAKMTAEQYWNSLSAEEQQKLLEGKERVVERARDRWQKKTP
uniref:DUF3106 domain-containing protein n=1 Tax=Desulfacinum infernum TaxID=35837 RepID=A0A832A8C7_9BACT